MPLMMLWSPSVRRSPRFSGAKSCGRNWISYIDLLDYAIRWTHCQTVGVSLSLWIHNPFFCLFQVLLVRIWLHDPPPLLFPKFYPRWEESRAGLLRSRTLFLKLWRMMPRSTSWLNEVSTAAALECIVAAPKDWNFSIWFIICPQEILCKFYVLPTRTHLYWKTMLDLDS